MTQFSYLSSSYMQPLCSFNWCLAMPIYNFRMQRNTKYKEMIPNWLPSGLLLFSVAQHVNTFISSYHLIKYKLISSQTIRVRDKINLTYTWPYLTKSQVKISKNWTLLLMVKNMNFSLKVIHWIYSKCLC